MKLREKLCTVFHSLAAGSRAKFTNNQSKSAQKKENLHHQIKLSVNPGKICSLFQLRQHPAQQKKKLDHRVTNAVNHSSRCTMQTQLSSCTSGTKLLFSYSPTPARQCTQFEEIVLIKIIFPLVGWLAGTGKKGNPPYFSRTLANQILAITDVTDGLFAPKESCSAGGRTLRKRESFPGHDGHVGAAPETRASVRISLSRTL